MNRKRLSILKILLSLFVWAMFVGALIEEMSRPIISKDGTYFFESAGIIHTGSNVLDEALKFTCLVIAVVTVAYIIRMFDMYRLSKK